MARHDDGDDGGGADSGGDGDLESNAGERKGPVLVAGLLACGLPFLTPSSFHNVVGFGLSFVQLVLLMAMLVLDPGRIDRRSAKVHAVRLALIGVMASGAAVAAARLVYLIVRGDSATAHANQLLWAGGLVWVHLVLAFAFLYWELDAGGPGERAHHPPGPGDLLFPQQGDLERFGDWRPAFFDYFHVAATGAISFSPADAVCLTHRMKAVSIAESASSLAVLGLVVARAVNILN